MTSASTNRALGASEVVRLYQSGAVKFTTSTVELQRGSTLANGLVGLWTFDGPDVTDKVYDRSGQGNNGYFYGGSTSSAKVAGHLGQALTFDGSTNYVSTSQNAGATPSTPFSVSVWAKKVPGSADAVLVNTAPESDPFDGVWVQYGFDGANDTPRFAIVSSGSGGEILDAANSIAAGVWHHIVMTYDGSQNISGMKIYVDGGAVSTIVTDNSGFGAFTDRPWRIGTDTNVPPQDYFNGSIDDVRIYNRAFSATEVQQLSKLGTVTIKNQ